ncbi:hypothetical protein FACS189421_08740 [Bacteroidia bacterium]|nr:hypothetical protein FACS189421_08740 [Bacteroidia bacterium]
MKMKKMIFLMLTLMILGAASMNAQVKIGGDGTTSPVTGAVLELDGAQGALLLPNVDTLRTSIATPVAGMQVYRPADNKVYVYDGTSWKASASVGVGVGAPVITTQPKAFSFSRLRDTNGDPSGPSAAAAIANIGKLTVEAVGDGLQYQWYEKSTNKNAPDTKLTGTSATTNEYVYSAADIPDVNVANWGMKSYYVVVSDANGNSVTSAIADVALGCGAKTATGGWLKFQCYNLGATTTGSPFVFDANILGEFHQWGRPGAAERTNTETEWTNATAYPYDWKIPNGYDTPFTNAYHQDDYLWRNHKNGANDPCPDGWHVPSQSAFGAIFKGTADADVPANATANTWTATGNFVDVTGTGGYAIKPDGSTTTLFFPAAGNRSTSNGALYYVGLAGHYWSSTPAGTGAYSLAIGSGRVYPSYINLRGNGFSVRCISE